MGDGSWVKVAAAIFPWAAAIVIVLALGLIFLGVRIGCVDYVAESGMEGTCTSGSAIGVPGAWFFGAASAIALSYCGYRIIRAGRGQ